MTRGRPEKGYAKLHRDFWDNPKIQSLPASAQRTYMLLFSQPDLSACGVLGFLPARWARMACDTTAATVEADIAVLERAGMVLVDREWQELYVREFPAHDGIFGDGDGTGAQPNRVKGMWAQFTKITSPVIMRAVADDVPDEFKAPEFNAPEWVSDPSKAPKNVQRALLTMLDPDDDDSLIHVGSTVNPVDSQGNPYVNRVDSDESTVNPVDSQGQPDKSTVNAVDSSPNPTVNRVDSDESTVNSVDSKGNPYVNRVDRGEMPDSREFRAADTPGTPSVNRVDSESGSTVNPVDSRTDAPLDGRETAGQATETADGGTLPETLTERVTEKREKRKENLQPRSASSASPPKSLAPLATPAEDGALFHIEQDKDAAAMAKVGVTREQVQQVFDAWVSATGKDAKRTKLDRKREKRIVAALKDYPMEDVLDAVVGWQFSDYHCAKSRNNTKTVYNQLDMLLRDADQIEKFRDLARSDGRNFWIEGEAHDGIRRTARFDRVDESGEDVPEGKWTAVVEDF